MHALHSIPQQIKVALQWMMMMVMVTKKLKRLPANGAVGAKRCRGKRVSGPGATTRSPARVGGSRGDGGDDGWW